MKTFNKIALFFLSIISLISCVDGNYSLHENSFRFKSENLIVSYVDFDGILAERKYENEISLSLIVKKWYFHNEIFENKGFVFVGENNEGDNESYLKLAQKNKDVSYNKFLVWADLKSGSTYPSSTTKNFTSFSIKSDKDFDETHPAGAELGDIFYFVGQSYYPYINSGYKEISNDTVPKIENMNIGYYEYSITEYENGHYQQVEFRNDNEVETKEKRFLSFVCKKVSDLTAEDLKLLFVEPFNRETRGYTCYFGDLQWAKIPTKSKSHNLTIRLTTDEGETFEAKCLVEF